MNFRKTPDELLTLSIHDAQKIARRHRLDGTVQTAVREFIRRLHQIQTERWEQKNASHSSNIVKLSERK